MTESAIRRAILENGPTTLYRLYDGTGRLLYVGISGHEARRLLQHAERKPWWPSVAHVAFERFATRAQAAEAEIDAICEEKPVHNVVGQTEGALPPLPAMAIDLSPLDPLAPPDLPNLIGWARRHPHLATFLGLELPYAIGGAFAFLHGFLAWQVWTDIGVVAALVAELLVIVLLTRKMVLDVVSTRRRVTYRSLRAEHARQAPEER